MVVGRSTRREPMRHPESHVRSESADMLAKSYNVVDDDDAEVCM